MSVIFFGVAGYLGSILYERVISDEISTGPAQAESAGVADSYPSRIEIESADGRVMMVTLLGRSSTHIEFTRDDREGFVYPIDSLNADSQALVRRYSNDGIENATSYVAKGSLGIDDLYVQELEKRIRAINEEMTELSQKYGSITSKVERRTIQRAIEGLRTEKAELQRKVSGKL